jgi:hypothetical protein
MQLPGGLYRQDGIVEREWDLRPLNGHLELALWDAWHGSRSKVDCITRTIASTIKLPGDCDEDTAAAGLSVADRQFLLAQLACHLGASRFWISADCPSCRERFDVPVDLTRLPIKPAGEGYPFAEAEISSGAVKVRAPTGTDQAAIQNIADERQAMVSLVRRCIVPQAGREPVEQTFTDDDLNAIDEAFQHVASEIASAVTSRCPNCGTENSTPFDLSALLLSSLRNPLEEVHDIAAVYHWSEGEILALPRERRHQYLALIDQRRGAHR